MHFAKPGGLVTPGKSGLPSSRCVGNSAEAMQLTSIVSRERQRIVHVCEIRNQARVCREAGYRRAAGILVFRQVAGG